MGIIEISATALLVSVVTNLIKKLVEKYGSLAVQVSVLALSIIAAFVWTYWGKTYDWTFVLEVLGVAFAWYEIIIKRFWTAK